MPESSYYCRHMNTIRKSRLNQILHILLSAFILQQSFAYDFLNKSIALTENATCKTCLVEVLGCIRHDDIDSRFPAGTDLPEPQQSSEDDRNETEPEDKELILFASSWAADNLQRAFSHNTVWISSNFSFHFTPPPELG